MSKIAKEIMSVEYEKSEIEFLVDQWGLVTFAQTFFPHTVFFKMDLVAYLRNIKSNYIENKFKDNHFYNTVLLYRSELEVLQFMEENYNVELSFSRKKTLSNLLERHPSEITLELFYKFYDSADWEPDSLSSLLIVNGHNTVFKYLVDNGEIPMNYTKLNMYEMISSCCLMNGNGEIFVYIFE